MTDWHEAKTTLLKPWANPTAEMRTGLLIDFDGTLSPIVPNPDDARISPRAAEALKRLRGRLALIAFISGRAVNDLRVRAGLEGAVYIGNHGLERLIDRDIVTPPEVLALRPAYELAMAQIGTLDIDGLRLEDKRVSLSLHYRNTPDPAAAAAQLGPFLDRLAAQHHLSLHRGRMVFELRPPFTINKGTALADLIAAHRLDAALFIGDDTTDADAMAVARGLRAEGRCHAVAVGVQSDETPPAILEQADLLVDGVAGVEAFLEWLAAAGPAVPL